MQRIDEIDGTYHLDAAHSAVGFTVRHAGLTKVRGTFDSFHGYAIIDATNQEYSALMVTLSTASINTFVADRDAHLRSADFFDVETFPTITYVGTHFEILDEQRVRVDGDLTVKDVTRPLSLEFSYTGGARDPFGNERIGFETTTQISRKDFGLTWNAALETGGWLVSDEIKIEIEASAVKQLVEVPEGDFEYMPPALPDFGDEELNEAYVRELTRPRRALADDPEDSQVLDEQALGVQRAARRRAVEDTDEVELQQPITEVDRPQASRAGWRRLLQRR
ncbi:YceI family protein [Luteococcus peritonei]|uniref:YceI family protein n=1 Tax=Luteococcus peritonei TaxID=88874 RepID=A0ABW4RUU9_9ACTN